MNARQVEGAALLIAGHGGAGAAAFDASAVHTLGQIGETLLATGAPWQIRRLTASAGERYAADRATLKRSIDELVAESLRVAVIVVAGTIVEVGGAPALVTGPRPHDYPEDATLPLAWIGERLRTAKAEQVVVVVSAEGDGSPARWLDAIATRLAHHAIAVDRGSGAVIDALLTGLCGDALDPRTGTVTMASLCDHLAARAPAAVLQASAASETLAQPPPLAGLWDVRRSQLSQRPTRPRPGERDDLTGAVLPGRFRLDGVLARGTFGTVYRARQLAVERDVAVKVIHADIDPSSEDGRLFVHEIRSVGRLDHANVVRIHQADITHDGRLFFAMELLGGSDLQQLGGATDGGKLPRARAVELVRQLLAGLDAAHAAGLVHADVKPANAIVVGKDDSERVVLVDFGLSRLRAPDRPSASAGGTPAYMAPEQLHEGRVDARSDLFSAALVLVFLVTGWRRPNAFTLIPPFEIIEDDALRDVLRRALDADPAKRYQSARELSAALTGTAAAAPTTSQPIPALPFRHLAPLTEADRGRLHGRETDLAVLTEHALFRRSVIYTAPSGTGKTSMLRAGLVPRLEALGVQTIYHRCRISSTTALAGAIWPGAITIAEAITTWHSHGGGKLVLVLDQLEAALVDAELVRAVLAFDRFPVESDVAVILSVREDYLARLVAQTQTLEPGMPIVRLPPLSLDGARNAIVAPLTESRLAIEPELLDVLLSDLERAAAAIGPEMGWGETRAVYPPHLQLACSVLYEALAPGAATLALADYRRLGGFDAIVGEHLERVIDTELAGGRDAIARDLFLALVTTAHERAVRPESELVAIAGATHGPANVIAVLEILRSRGLLVRIRDAGGEPGWELVHDSLVARVLAWIDRRDLARRRAVELVRYHVRRSRPDAPSLLGRAELRELRPYGDAITELDTDWRKRTGTTDADAWSPARLVERSRQVLRRRTATLATVVIAALAVASIGMYKSRVEERRAREEARLKSLDLGRFTLAIEAFDWDPVAHRASAVAPSQVSALGWQLYVADPADEDQPGTAFAPSWVVRGKPRVDAGAAVEDVESRGGRAFLVVTRGDCGPSVVPLRQLPGYTQREHQLPVVRVRIPTCRASQADMIAIPAGPFIYGGIGEPPSQFIAQNPDFSTFHERLIDLPAFAIDRVEVTNAAYSMFASMTSVTGISPPQYPDTPGLRRGGDPRLPVTGIDWVEARAYCRYLGKELVTSEQWVKAMRGGERLPDGSLNPMPRRNLPWGAPRDPIPARIATASPAETGTHPGDVSVYGVHDLAGNATEWTASQDTSGTRIVRGGNWSTTAETLVDYEAVENARAQRYRNYSTGARCSSAR